MIGSVEYINGLPYFTLEYCEQGFVFKDEEAYKNNWFAPCYIPEYYEGEPVTINGKGLIGGESKCWYSHMDLLEECREYLLGMDPDELQEIGVKDEYELCDRVFEAIDWQHPSTYLQEINY